MKNRNQIWKGAFLSILIAIGCKTEDKKFDATGTFEADEVIVSAEMTGKLLEFNITEGDTVSKGKIIGRIDPLSIALQKEQIEASIGSLTEKSNDAAPQVAVFKQQQESQRSQIRVQEQQLAVLQKEQNRMANLVKAEAATQKQLDDITGQMDVLKRQIEAAQTQISVIDRQIAAQSANVGIQNRGIMSEKAPLQKRIAQLNDQIKRTNIENPQGGTVLSVYAKSGELAAMGKALYKIADMKTLILRAYMSGSQLSQIKINQTVKVMIDNGVKEFKELKGTVSWVSDKAEFTPKTIQTKDERANLVYAMKIKVPNDGSLKLGMYGEVLFQ
jgi:HlyD family secretion protein